MAMVLVLASALVIGDWQWRWPTMVRASNGIYHWLDGWSGECAKWAAIAPTSTQCEDRKGERWATVAPALEARKETERVLCHSCLTLDKASLRRGTFYMQTQATTTQVLCCAESKLEEEKSKTMNSK